MQLLEVSGAVGTIYGSLGVKRLILQYLHTAVTAMYLYLFTHLTTSYSTVCDVMKNSFRFRANSG